MGLLKKWWFYLIIIIILLLIISCILNPDSIIKGFHDGFQAGLK